MVLEDITELNQFPQYYKQFNLRTVEEKINRLRKETGIVGIRGEQGRKPEDLLALLEFSTLEGYWRAK
jgi:hypothetical protein